MRSSKRKENFRKRRTWYKLLVFHSFANLYFLVTKKTKLKIQLDAQLERFKQTVNDMKRKQEENLTQIRNDIQKIKHEEFIKLKQQREDNDSKKKSYVEEIQRFNAYRKQTIKAQDLVREERKKELLGEKTRMVREIYQTRIQNEEKLKQQKEQKIIQLEDTESRLIERLKATQSLQLEALKQLEVAMTEPAESYSQKYEFTPRVNVKSFLDFSVAGSEVSSPRRSEFLKRVKSGGNLQIEKIESMTPVAKEKPYHAIYKPSASYRGVPNKLPKELTFVIESPKKSLNRQITDEHAKLASNKEINEAENNFPDMKEELES